MKSKTQRVAASQDPADDGWFIDESVNDAVLAARESERFGDRTTPRVASRAAFPILLALALILHAAIIAAFLYRDAHEPTRTAQMDETPVEIVVEPPPEPVKPPAPPQQKPPAPPRPKEDLRPAFSAPRAPTEEKVKTETKEAKTAAPTKLETPTQGQPQSTPAVAPPKEAAPDETKQDETAKEEDKTKPDAEALDKARRKAAKQSKSKEAKAAPKRKQVPNALAALAGAPTLDTTMSFAKPTPKTKIYGGTDDVRWMSEVEAMLEAKVGALPRTEHYQSGGLVAICFHVDERGRVILQEYCKKSGYPDVDRLAMRALEAAAPFPPPPPGLDRGLMWTTTFDGQLPKLHFR